MRPFTREVGRCASPLVLTASEMCIVERVERGVLEATTRRAVAEVHDRQGRRREQLEVRRFGDARFEQLRQPIAADHELGDAVPAEPREAAQTFSARFPNVSSNMCSHGQGASLLPCAR